MQEFKPRPEDAKTEEKSGRDVHFEPVNKESTPVEEPGFWKRTGDAIFKGRKSGRSLFEDIWFGSIIPTGVDMVTNAAKNTIDSIFYNTLGFTVTNNVRTSGPSYGTAYERSRGRVQTTSEPVLYSNGNKPTYKDLTFRSLGEAQYAKSQLEDAVIKYQYARVAYLIELANNSYINASGLEVPLTPDPVDYDFGWADIRNARIYPVGGGKYKIDLPTPAPLN